MTTYRIQAGLNLVVAKGMIYQPIVLCRETENGLEEVALFSSVEQAEAAIRTLERADMIKEHKRNQVNSQTSMF